VLLAAGAAVAGSALPTVEAAAATAKVSPVSMATHIHGPFSEGVASYAAHLEQARKYKVDVVWFTDHDFRIAAFGHRQAVHFDGVEEPEHGLGWTWKQHVVGKPDSHAADFVAAPHSPQDGSGKALRLAAAGGGAVRFEGVAWNAMANACVADTELTLDVLPEQVGAGGALTLDVQLSNQPGKGILRVAYHMGGGNTVTHKADGAQGTVRLPAKPGVWQRFTFVLRDDIVKLWPDVVAGDNALTGLALEVRQGRFVVDRLTFTRSRRAGQAGEQLRAEVIAAVAKQYPDVTQFRALEVSMVRHLNWFGGDLTLPAFPTPPLRDNDAALTGSMVRWLHAHGGLVCWNHPMDVAKRDELAKLIVSQAALGVDLVEIGRDPLEDLLWVYDVAARNAVFFTAVGGSDDHDATDWAANEEHRISHVWSPTKSRADLLRALSAGAAWFTDLTSYRGAMDLRVGGVSYMGAVLVGTAPVTVDVSATKLPKGASLEIVTGTVGTGLKPSTTVTVYTSGKRQVKLQPGTYVRTQVRLKDKTIAGVSNPLWLLTKAPAAPIPAARKRALPY
jgi:predicted metal-dependent phosphoesterase TrpH